MRTLLGAMQPEQIEIIDDSHKHAGHEGARSGGGHYTLHIVSAQFAGKTTLARHRIIYSTLGEMMKQDIHAPEPGELPTASQLTSLAARRYASSSDGDRCCASAMLSKLSLLVSSGR